MLLIRKSLFVLLVLCGTAGLLALGAAGYRALAAPQPDPEDARLAGETLLFVAMLAAAILALAGGLLLLRGRGIVKELSRIAELSRAGAFAVDERLRRLGAIGESVRRILVQTSELNRRYALKVSTLAGLNDFLLNNSALQLIVADASGRVTGASRGYRDAAGTGGANLEGRSIGDVLEGCNYTAIYGRLERERAVLTSPDDPDLHFVPVTNRAGEVACVVCVLGKKPLVSEAPGVAPSTRRRFAMMGRLLRRRDRRS